MDLDTDRVDAHNRVQRTHFAVEAADNPRMRPADTPYVHRHVDRMVRLAGLARDERILDVGCGMGKFTLPLLRRGYEVEGLDLSPELLQVFRGHLRPDEDPALHCADLLSAPEELHGRYDVVVGFFMLHHLIELTIAFRHLRHLLRPGGRVAFIEPNGRNPLYYAQITLTPGMSWRSDHGVVRMTQRRLTGALLDAGYDEVHGHQEGALPPALLNRPWGPRLEETVDRLAPLRPLGAFQLLRGTSPGPE